MKSFGEAAQEGEGFLRCQGFCLPLTELVGELGEKMEVVPERVFFSNSACGNLEKTLRLEILS